MASVIPDRGGGDMGGGDDGNDGGGGGTSLEGVGSFSEVDNCEGYGESDYMYYVKDEEIGSERVKYLDIRDEEEEDEVELPYLLKKPKSNEKKMKDRFREALRDFHIRTLRARTRAIKVVQGDHKEQYYRPRDYLQAVIDTNPDTRCIITTFEDSENPAPTPRFKYMFYRLHASKQGFLNGCTPFIATGRDGNNNIYPIAFGVVDKEYYDSWTWFLTQLRCYIGSGSKFGTYTIISDTQKMMRNHARCLLKVMTAAEKQRAIPRSFTIPSATILLWAMREAQHSPDPMQRARWWVYHSSTTPSVREDPGRVAYRAEHVTDVVLSLSAPINNAYWERRNSWVLGPNGDSKVDSSDDESYDDDVEELVILSDDETDVQLLAPALDVVEGNKNLPIDMEKLPEVADLPEVVVVKQEVLEEDVVAPAPGKKKRAAGKKTAVRLSERLKMLKKEE
ncbi:MATE efflux family protein 3, chloroplastic [Hordeum vulgare]|nr:MATE efflux family protein 3, chloroplastic [Hordeum vulgare]